MAWKKCQIFLGVKGEEDLEIDDRPRPEGTRHTENKRDVFAVIFQHYCYTPFILYRTIYVCVVQGKYLFYNLTSLKRLYEHFHEYDL